MQKVRILNHFYCIVNRSNPQRLKFLIKYAGTNRESCWETFYKAAKTKRRFDKWKQAEKELGYIAKKFRAELVEPV